MPSLEKVENFMKTQSYEVKSEKAPEKKLLSNEL